MGTILTVRGTIPARAQGSSPHERVVITLGPERDGQVFRRRFNEVARELDRNGGGTIKLLPGVYATDHPLLLLGNTKLVGSGQVGESASIIRLEDRARSFVNRAGIVRSKREGVSLPKRFVENVAMSDLVIDGNRSNQRQDVYDEEKKYGFYAEARDMIVRRVTIHSCMGYGFDPHGGVGDVPSERLIIEDCHAYGNLKDGFTLDRQVDMICRRNLSENNDRAGINIVTTTLRTKVIDNVCRNNAGVGVFVQNGSGEVEIEGNEISGNALEGIYLRNSHDCVITGNRIRGNGRAGIRVRGGRKVLIDGNEVGGNLLDHGTGQSEIHLDDYDGSGPENVVVVGNKVRADRNGVLYEGRMARNNLVTRNVFASLANGIDVGGDGSSAVENVEMAY